jgi:hypothetical protein
MMMIHPVHGLGLPVSGLEANQPKKNMSVRSGLVSTGLLWF